MNDKRKMKAMRNKDQYYQHEIQNREQQFGVSIEIHL